MTSECEFCGTKSKLKDSHIIPRFVFKHLKKTGATPFLRKAEDPDERVQDYTEKLLCGDCEQQLNQYESPFARYIYHPYVKEQSGTFEYDNWLHYFTISVNWRLIISEMSEWRDLPAYRRDAITDSRDIWFETLQERRSIKHDPYTHHMVLLHDLDMRTDPGDLPEKWEFYRDRAIDATVVHGVGTHYYFKLPRFAFFSCIQPPEVAGFANTEIEPSGKISTQQTIPQDWEDFLITRAKQSFDQEKTEGSLENATEWMLERPERAVESDSFRAWNESMIRRIENHDPIQYLEGDCPVCFTNHRVIESLPSRPITQEEAESFGDRFVYFEPIYYEDELEHKSMPTGVTSTIVLSTEEKTMQIALYTDKGWIVEKEIDLQDDMDPQEIGEMLREATYEGYVEFAEKHR